MSKPDDEMVFESATIGEDDARLLCLIGCLAVTQTSLLLLADKGSEAERMEAQESARDMQKLIEGHVAVLPPNVCAVAGRLAGSMVRALRENRLKRYMAATMSAGKH